MSPEHRRPEGTRQVGPTWESLIERQIREAMEEGAFEQLPHQGKPLPLEDDSAAGEFALAHRMLRNAGGAPPWIESDKEARARLADLERLVARAKRADRRSLPRLRQQATELVAAVNHAVERVNVEAPTDRQHRRPLVLEGVLGRLDARTGGPG
jgi:hypothetical protein